MAIVQVSMTPAEVQEIKAAATYHSLSLAAYVRMHALAAARATKLPKPVPVPPTRYELMKKALSDYANLYNKTVQTKSVSDALELRIHFEGREYTRLEFIALVEAEEENSD